MKRERFGLKEILSLGQTSHQQTPVEAEFAQNITDAASTDTDRVRINNYLDFFLFTTVT